MATTPAARQSFINSTIEVAREYGFDGLDLDWEFPKDEKEMEDFGVLLGEWRVAVRREAELTRRPVLLITAAVYFASNFTVDEAKRGYPDESIARNLNWASPIEEERIGEWEEEEKIRLELGRVIGGIQQQDQETEQNHEIGAPAVGLGPGERGVLTFKQVWDFNKANRATVVYDSVTVSMYSYSGIYWIGYDDRESVALKVRFAKALGLRGYFFWWVGLLGIAR
ncbi:hypothetical protein Sjap_019036 [Stephania japonica]|uniref:GH18 domain-containing protein n=1 Tax=Stephania japonica TaxID=461633 RepID=A0AAP0F0U5_9MAGN